MRINTHNNQRRKNCGMTLMEVAIAMPIIMLALGMFVQMLTAGTSLRESSRENWLATLRTQDILELMRNADFEQIIALYNEDPFDDPGGPGTAPGADFNVDGLAALDNDTDGFVGRIMLPSTDFGTPVAPDWQVREDMVEPELGMPRDLNGDNVVDDENHGTDYTTLPVMVEVRWQNRFGPRTVRIHTLFSEI